MEKKFSKILVGIDGSQYSMNAASYALELFEKYDCELIILSIVPSKVHHGDSSGVFGMVSPSLLDDYKKKSQKWFEEILNLLDRQKIQQLDKKIKTDVITSPFSIAASILNYAEERDVDLIIIGTRGNSGLKKMLLGSVATDIVTYSYCPVLVIK